MNPSKQGGILYTPSEGNTFAMLQNVTPSTVCPTCGTSTKPKREYASRTDLFESVLELFDNPTVDRVDLDRLMVYHGVKQANEAVYRRRLLKRVIDHGIDLEPVKVGTKIIGWWTK